MAVITAKAICARVGDVRGRSWQDMIKAGGCLSGGMTDFVIKRFSLACLPPLPKDEQGVTKTLLIGQDGEGATTNREWLQRLDENKSGKMRFAHPLSVLARIESDPDGMQLEDTLFTIWRDPREGRENDIWVLWVIPHGGGVYLRAADRMTLENIWKGVCWAVVVER